MSASHRHPVRVYYEDTDAGGIVYHANYLKFAERARTEWLRERGLDRAALQREHGVGFVARRCTAEYLKPARLDDLLEVETRILEAGRVVLRLAQDVQGSTGLICAMQVDLVCVDAALRPARLPTALRLLAAEGG